MSTTTVSYRASAHQTSLDALRRQQAEARRAAREAQARRRAEEQLRRRLEDAGRAVDAQESRFQKLVERLDQAARRLPDLMLAAPTLAPVSPETAQDPDKHEAYGRELGCLIRPFSRTFRSHGSVA